jgi:hypothetical protein
MNTREIWDAFTGIQCAGCGGVKRKFSGFCVPCYRQLPKALQNTLWQKFGSGFEQAYQACLSWFRTHPLQGEHRAEQRNLF